MWASSQASRELSTASFTVVRRALEGESKPRRCRFLEKNSETEISRCRWARSSAVDRLARGGRVAFRGAGASTFFAAVLAGLAGAVLASAVVAVWVVLDA